MTTDKTLTAVYEESSICYSYVGTEGLPVFVWPLQGSMFDYEWFENRWDYDWLAKCGGVDLKHIALDIQHKVNDTVNKEVRAAYKGIVADVYNAGRDWGQAVTIEHIDDNGAKFTTNYTHIYSYVKKGDEPKQGEIIGKVNWVNHLHFSIRRAPYSNISNAGALPVIDQHDCTCKYKAEGKTYVRPLFPEYFVDPSTVYYMSLP